MNNDDLLNRLIEIGQRMDKIENTLFILEKSLSKTNEVVQGNVTNSVSAFKHITELVEMYKTLSTQFVSATELGIKSLNDGARNTLELGVLFKYLLNVRRSLGLDNDSFVKDWQLIINSSNKEE